MRFVPLCMFLLLGSCSQKKLRDPLFHGTWVENRLINSNNPDETLKLEQIDYPVFKIDTTHKDSIHIVDNRRVGRKVFGLFRFNSLSIFPHEFQPNYVGMKPVLFVTDYRDHLISYNT
ncbi:MAG: hypothetical protein ACRCVT_00375, partial [Leadbetterella sp.]